MKKKLILLTIVIIPVLLLITYLALEKFSLSTPKSEVKSPFQNLSEQIEFKYFNLNKPALLYDGSKLTIYDIQIYEPTNILRSGFSDKSKYLAVALDVEFESLPQSKLFLDNAPSPSFYNENVSTTKELIQDVPYEMRLIDVDTVGRLQPHYVRLAHEVESAQPNLFTTWMEKEKKIIDAHDSSTIPTNVRGWVTYIFKIEDWAENEKVDYTYGKHLVLRYKNGSQDLKELLIELGKLADN